MKQYLEIYKLALDASGRSERLTHFNDYLGYKATNPVVSDDGQYMAFQFAKKGDKAGIGRGILIFDLVMYEKMKKSQGKQVIRSDVYEGRQAGRKGPSRPDK